MLITRKTLRTQNKSVIILRILRGIVMFILKTPKTLRKHLRTKIKRTNQKKLKVERLSFKEYIQEVSRC